MSEVGKTKLVTDYLEGVEDVEEMRERTASRIGDVVREGWPFVFVGVGDEIEDTEGESGHSVATAGFLDGDVKQLLSLVEMLKEELQRAKAALADLVYAGMEDGSLDPGIIMTATLSLTDMSMDSLIGEAVDAMRVTKVEAGDIDPEEFFEVPGD